VKQVFTRDEVYELLEYAFKQGDGRVNDDLYPDTGKKILEAFEAGIHFTLGSRIDDPA
jgi:hypothetical protein